MILTDNKEKQRSLDLAEDSRESEWRFASLIGEMFNGSFRWDLVHPFPKQNLEDTKRGDLFLEKLEHCLKEHIDPDEVDRASEIPDSAIKALADIGCFGMKIPEEYGGLGFSQTNYNRAIALVASHCASTAVLLSAHQSIGVPQPLKLFGTEEQKRKYLPRLAKGEISAFALTELEVGSDPARMETIATPTDDGQYYLLNGEKLWCTNGPIADLLIVMAKTPPVTVHGREKTQITAFIVEATSPGFEVVHRCSFMGLHGISNGILRFNDVKVAKDNIIGKPGMGLKIALVTLNTGRLTLPAASTAVNKLCLKWSRLWGKSRHQWGLPIGEHQAIGDKLAEIAANTFATDSVTRLASAYVDAGCTDVRLEAAVAKYFCTEVAWDVIDTAVQIRGGRGYESSDSLRQRGELPFPLERTMRDMRINRIIEGTSEIMRLFIAREAMDKHFQRIMPLLNTRLPLGDRIKLGIKALGYYAIWYPKQWLILPIPARTRYLSKRNKRHLSFINKTTKKLSRRLFHAMVRYQQKLEKQQLILFRFVEIGTDLFAMSVCLSRAERLMADNPDDETPQALADYFCRKAEGRIKRAFTELGKPQGKIVGKISKSILEEEIKWLEEGIIGS